MYILCSIFVNVRVIFCKILMYVSSFVNVRVICSNLYLMTYFFVHTYSYNKTQAPVCTCISFLTCISCTVYVVYHDLLAFFMMSLSYCIIWNIHHGCVFYLVYHMGPNKGNFTSLCNQYYIIALQKPDKSWRIKKPSVNCTYIMYQKCFKFKFIIDTVHTFFVIRNLFIF